MHEYALLEGVIKAILDQIEEKGHAATAGSVKEVVLKVGILDVHSEESCRQAFEVLTRDTILEKTLLSLIVEPATLECSSCGYKGECPEGQVDGHNPVPYTECPECGGVAGVVGGRGVESIEYVLENTDRGS